MRIQLSDHFSYGRLLRFTLPSIAMMIFTSIYGVVDGIFVSNFAGKVPFAAINLIMPYIMAFGTLGFMVGTGGTALISMQLGMGDRKEANGLFSLFTAVLGIGGFLLMAIAVLFLPAAAAAMGAADQMLEDCVTYGRIVLLALPAYIMQFAYQSFCVAAEKPNLSLWMTVAAGVCNILLDALFVAVFRWGLVGAAWATAIAQILGAVIPLVYFARPNGSLLRLGTFRFDGKALVRTCVNGSSELMSNLSMSLASMLYNLQLIHYAGEDGVAAFGVIMYINFIFLAVFIGFSIGTAPIIGYNHGADNRSELKNVTRKCLILVGVFAGVMTLSAELMADPLSGIFVSYDPALMEMTAWGFRIYSVSFLFCGFNIFGSSLFTALNNGLVSALISFMRALVCQVAAIMILPLVWGLDGVWWANVAAELVALMPTVCFIVKFRKRYHYL